MKRNIMFIIAAALSAAAIAALPAAAAQKGRLEDATGQPAEKIVFATTTPMNTNGKLGGNPCTTESIRRYNAAAVAVTQAEDVAVTTFSPLQKSGRYPNTPTTATSPNRLRSVSAVSLPTASRLKQNYDNGVCRKQQNNEMCRL